MMMISMNLMMNFFPDLFKQDFHSGFLTVGRRYKKSVLQEILHGVLVYHASLCICEERLEFLSCVFIV